jgi:predicted nucleic acid-binding protein
LAKYFFDTSALVKYYHTELGSNCVSAIFAEPDRVVRVSNLGVLEAQSVFAMKVRSGELERSVAGMFRARLMLDIAAGSLETYGITPGHFREAEHLIGRYGHSRRLRTLDALQLAIALDLKSLDLVDFIVAADKALLETKIGWIPLDQT